jgi:hypothetical protein
VVEAQHLLRAKWFAGAIYLAGRGVEGMLRAVVWKRDVQIQLGRKSLETGHDLRDLLVEIANLGLLRRNDRDEQFRAHVHQISRLWFNDMRFVSARFVERRWKKIGAISPRGNIGGAAVVYHGLCLEVAKRCEALCDQ